MQAAQASPQLGMARHTCHPGTQEEEGSWQVQGQDYKLRSCLKCSNNNKAIITH